MKVEIELKKDVIEMLERYRNMRSKYFVNEVKTARNEDLRNFYREQAAFYEGAGYEHLTSEYLKYQTIFEDKKTD